MSLPTRSRERRRRDRESTRGGGHFGRPALFWSQPCPPPIAARIREPFASICTLIGSPRQRSDSEVLPPSGPSVADWGLIEQTVSHPEPPGNTGTVAGPNPPASSTENLSVP